MVRKIVFLILIVLSTSCMNLNLKGPKPIITPVQGLPKAQSLIGKNPGVILPEYKVFSVTTSTNTGAAVHLIGFAALNWVTPTDTKFHSIYLVGEKVAAAGNITRVATRCLLTAVTGNMNFSPQGIALGPWAFDPTQISLGLSSAESTISFDKNEIIFPKGVTVSILISVVDEFAIGDTGQAKFVLTYSELPH